MKKTGVLCILFTFTMVAVFEYDRALVHAKNENWQEAISLLRTLVTDHPEDKKLLYDMGVASYKSEEYLPAGAYFSEVLAASNVTEPLYEQALFNRGNTYVKLHQLHKALDDYESVLRINPDNERAVFNRDLVRKMLDQQQEEQKQGDSEQESTSTQDDTQDSEDQQSKHDTDESSDDDNSEQKNEDQEDTAKRTNPTTQEQEKDSSPESDELPSRQPIDQNESETDRSTAEETDPYEGLQDWVSAALKDRDEKDSELNKQMIRRMIQSQTGNYEHCW